MGKFRAAYLDALESGLLDEKIKTANAVLDCCTLCPRECRINRNAGEKGVCKTADRAWVSSYNPHFGEEAPLVGQNGSGTIFFTHCNLGCSFCQNYDISHLGQGVEVTADQLAEMMCQLQDAGCHNINFVTPSHVVPQILPAVQIAAKKGLTVPLIYNSGGYDARETLQILEGIVDIYMPDFKFWDSEVARQTCEAPDYPEAARIALAEMHRQVGDLQLDTRRIACRGLLVRHLVLPRDLAGTREIMRYIAQNLSTNTYVNIMPQYRPCGKAVAHDGLDRAPTHDELEAALQAAEAEGIHRLDKRRGVFMVF